MMAGAAQNLPGSLDIPARISILVVATEDPAEPVAEILHGACEVRLCQSLEVLEERLADEAHIVLCDAEQCSPDWAEVLRRTLAKQPPPAFVLMSRLADEKLWSEVLNAGGYDVLPKPLQPSEAARVFGMAARHWRSQRERV